MDTSINKPSLFHWALFENRSYPESQRFIIIFAVEGVLLRDTHGYPIFGQTHLVDHSQVYLLSNPPAHPNMWRSSEAKIFFSDGQLMYTCGLTECGGASGASGAMAGAEEAERYNFWVFCLMLVVYTRIVFFTGIIAKMQRVYSQLVGQSTLW